jgi:hypothetical protein
VAGHRPPRAPGWQFVGFGDDGFRFLRKLDRVPLLGGADRGDQFR